MSDAQVDRTHEYEKLEGGQGRAVHFRPQRFRPTDLAPIEVAAQIFVAGRSVDVEVANVSPNGASLVLPQDLPFLEGDFARLTLRADGHDAYSGEIRVQWTRSGEPPLAGVAFVDSLFDLEEVFQLRNIQATHLQSVRPSQRGWRGVRHDPVSSITSARTARRARRRRSFVISPRAGRPISATWPPRTRRAG